MTLCIALYVESSALLGLMPSNGGLRQTLYAETLLVLNSDGISLCVLKYLVEFCYFLNRSDIIQHPLFL